jgi:hypothetical protein
MKMVFASGFAEDLVSGRFDFKKDIFEARLSSRHFQSPKFIKGVRPVPVRLEIAVTNDDLAVSLMDDVTWKFKKKTWIHSVYFYDRTKKLFIGWVEARVSVNPGDTFTVAATKPERWITRLPRQK